MKLTRSSIAIALGAVLLLGGSTTVAAAAPTPVVTSAAVCSTPWGSLAKYVHRQSMRQVVNARAGRHDCFNRLVVDVNGAASASIGFDVRYVPQVSQDGSGTVVPLRGGAFLQIGVWAPGYNSNGQPTYRPANKREAVNVSGFSTFRQVAYLGSFEGISGFGLGVRARLPFRVFVLNGPGSWQRLVIDVAHHW